MDLQAITKQEWEQFRKDTKGTDRNIHFNNAGASLPPDIVVETVVDYLREEAMCGGYETEAKYRELLENTYRLIAQLINATPDEIAIVENASTAWGIAFNGIGFKKGDVVICSEMEYVTNLLGFANAEKKHGIVTKVIPNDAQGNFSLQALEAAITSQTRLIAVTHIASSAGAMLPVADIGRIARKHGVLYLVDACQTVGQVPVDVEAIGCDMLAATGRKYLRAPRGTGFLYVRKAVQDDLGLIFMDGHSARLTGQGDYTTRNDARRFELFEKNRALTLGLAKAVEYALNIGVDRIWQRVQQLAMGLRTRLGNMPFITVHDTGEEQCGIVTFTVNEMDSGLVKSRLSEKNIHVSVGNAYSTPLYMDKQQLSSLVRASLHYYNTETETAALCDALMAIAGHSVIFA